VTGDVLGNGPLNAGASGGCVGDGAGNDVWGGVAAVAAGEAGLVMDDGGMTMVFVLTGRGRVGSVRTRGTFVCANVVATAKNKINRVVLVF
jgi:hypothetical protein